MKRYFFPLTIACLLAVIFLQQNLYAQDPPIENPRLNPQLMRKGIENARQSGFRFAKKAVALNVPSDWNRWIDSAWGSGLSTTDKLNIFDRFWTIVDQQYGGFPRNNIRRFAIQVWIVRSISTLPAGSIFGPMKECHS